MIEFDTYAGGAMLIIVCSLACVGGLLLARRFFHADELIKHNEVGGVLFSVVGTLYAVLLGLIVVDAMTKFQNARDISENEANNLADVFILADCLPQDKRHEVRELCYNYAKLVVNEEWNHMDDGKHSKNAQELAVRLMHDLTSFDPKTPNQQGLYPLMVQSACNVWNDRCDRVNIARHGIPAAEWVILILGGVITVVFSYFLGVENVRSQTIMVGMVALLLSLNIYLLMLFGYPFSGDLKVSSEAFQMDIEIFEKRILSSEVMK